MTAAPKPPARRRRADLPWLRPVALVAVTGLHVGAATWLAIPTRKLNTGEDAVEITIAQGQPEPPPPPPAPPPEPPPPPPPPPTPPPPPPPEPPPPPPPEPEPPPEPPKKVVEEAPALPPPPPPPPPRPKPATPPKPLPPKPQPPQPPPPPPPAAPTEPPQGEADAQAALAQAQLTYRDKFIQEVQKHRRDAGSPGKATVRVRFSTDAQGKVVQAEVVTSSGDEEKDSIALEMIAAADAGPPPDGHFGGIFTVNFNNRR
jgi:TonB family protein